MAAYDTYANADTYFATRLHVLAWTESTTPDKTKALTEASARIDRLRFKGVKVLEAQSLDWPRYLTSDDQDDDAQTATPTDIKIACYEIAFALLDGVDPEMEFENLAVSSQGFSSVRNTYARGDAPEHIAAGIPSAFAWRFLKPWLTVGNVTKLSRVS